MSSRSFRVLGYARARDFIWAFVNTREESIPISLARLSLHIFRAFTFSVTLAPIRCSFLGNAGRLSSGSAMDCIVFCRMDAPNFFTCFGLRPSIRPRSSTVAGFISAIAMICAFPRILKGGRFRLLALSSLNCRIDSSTAKLLGSSLLAPLNLRNSGLQSGLRGRTLLRISHSSSTQKSLSLACSSYSRIRLKGSKWQVS